MDEREMNYEVENREEETNLTTEQESSGGGMFVGVILGAALTGAVIGVKKLAAKRKAKKGEMGKVNKDEPIDVEAKEVETESGEATE